MRVAITAVTLLDGLGATEDNLAGRLPGLIAGAGLSEVMETDRVLLGALCLYRATKPSVT